MVVGFPTGGDNVCVTKGVVSRIDRSLYCHGRTALLAIQARAALCDVLRAVLCCCAVLCVCVCAQSTRALDAASLSAPPPRRHRSP